MFTAIITQPPFTYTMFSFPFFIQFNSRKTVLCPSILKAANPSWLWVSWVSFACWFRVFLSCYYFFFFFYSYTIVTTRTTTTITNNNVNKGEGTSKKPTVAATTSFYKLKLPISLTGLLNTYRTSTHWSTSKFSCVSMCVCALCLFAFAHCAFSSILFFVFFPSCG
jgi:hypothetical protein